MGCWHKWTKWVATTEYYYHKDYKDKKGDLLKFNRKTQTRTCIKCGYTQEERV